MEKNNIYLLYKDIFRKKPVMGRKKIKPEKLGEEKKQYLKQYKQNRSFSNENIRLISDNEIINNGSFSKRKLMVFNKKSCT